MPNKGLISNKGKRPKARRPQTVDGPERISLTGLDFESAIRATLATGKAPARTKKAVRKKPK